jgi:hypothetical protein
LPCPGFEQFNEVAGGVLKKNLFPSPALHDCIPEFRAVREKGVVRGLKVIDHDLYPVPATGLRGRSISHRLPRSTGPRLIEHQL